MQKIRNEERSVGQSREKASMKELGAELCCKGQGRRRREQEWGNHCGRNGGAWAHSGGLVLYMSSIHKGERVTQWTRLRKWCWRVLERDAKGRGNETEFCSSKVAWKEADREKLLTAYKFMKTGIRAEEVRLKTERTLLGTFWRERVIPLGILVGSRNGREVKAPGVSSPE